MCEPTHGAKFRLSNAEAWTLRSEALRELEAAADAVGKPGEAAIRRAAANHITVMANLLSDIGWNEPIDSATVVVGEMFPPRQLIPWLRRWTERWGGGAVGFSEDEARRLTQQLALLRIWHRLVVDLTGARD